LNRHELAARGILSPVRLPVSPLRHRLTIRKSGPYVKSKGKKNTQERNLPNELTIFPILCYLILIGAVAQLGERLNGIQEADGSIPFSSTIFHAYFIYILKNGRAVGSTGRRSESSRNRLGRTAPTRNRVRSRSAPPMITRG
jgi:hypothetical protein